MNEDASAKANTPVKARSLKYIFVLLVFVAFALVAVFWLLIKANPRGPLAQMQLADGRTLQIEAITYGTHHHVGHRSIIADRLSPWLPLRLRSRLATAALRSPESTIELERPGLVVWVNAINPATGTNVDCQGIRTEFVDKHGDSFGEDDGTWFGYPAFWRVGHVFYSYPRAETQLTFKVTPWRKGKQVSVTAQFENPHLSPGQNWSGEPVPQTKVIGSLEVTLARLNPRTNEQSYFQTPFKYLEPSLDLRRNGLPATGWSEPEWTAEDPTGNRGAHLGLHQPVLRFCVTAYPTETNTEAAILVGTLPRVNLAVLTNQVLWKLSLGTNELVALGVCPPGVYTFSEGNFDLTGPRMSAVRGGAPSGWTGKSQRVSPIKIKEWHGHYTPNPTIYVRAAQLKEPDRLGLRLRNDAGRRWIAKPEPQGSPDGVHPFLIEVPAEVTNIVPELVLLRPLQADFLVRTPTPQ